MKNVSRPLWPKKKIELSRLGELDTLLRDARLNTICREAKCPNISECFGQKQASFLILGTSCTRQCSFCNVEKSVPSVPDPDEPERVAQAVFKLQLKHVVITSPTRDDLADGGASHFDETVKKIKTANPGTTVELLVPDFKGDRQSLMTVAQSGAEIVGHNMETVYRLYTVRKGADYRRSLKVLKDLSRSETGIKTKSGVMLGLGEKEDEVLSLFRDLLDNGCGFLSIGQYLAPSKKHVPVSEYLPPERFEFYGEAARRMGFSHVESGTYVRSSYHASNYAINN